MSNQPPFQVFKVDMEHIFRHYPELIDDAMRAAYRRNASGEVGIYLVKQAEHEFFAIYRQDTQQLVIASSGGKESTTLQAESVQAGLQQFFSGAHHERN